MKAEPKQLPVQRPVPECANAARVVVSANMAQVTSLPRDFGHSPVARHYDRLAAHYAELYDASSPRANFYQMRARRVLEFLDGIEGGNLLEAGCATGEMVERLVGRGFRYHGVDISAGMIAACRRRFAANAQVQFDAGDACRLPLPPAHFDVVLCLGMLEYVADESAAIAALARVLKPGGVMIVSGQNAWSPYNAWHRFIYSRITGRQAAAIVHEFHTEDEYRRLLTRQGLSVEDIVYFDFDLVPPPFNRRMVGLQAAWRNRLESRGRASGKRLANGFLVKCRKPVAA